MGILKALFIGILLSFSTGVLIRISITKQAYVYPVDFFVMLFVLYGLYLLMIKRKKISWLGNWKYFVLIAALSLIINAFHLDLRELVVSSLYFVRLVMYIMITPIITSLFTKKDVKWLLYVITGGLGTTVLAGFVQYFLYPDLRNLIYLGWDEHLYRMFSSYLDPNFASVIFVLLFWLLIILKKIEKNIVVVRIISIAIVITAGAILLTYSRTGYVSWIGSFVVYMLITKNFKLIAVMILISIAGFIFLPRNLQSEGVDLFRTASISARVTSYKTALNLAQKNPILGVGFNAYRYAQDNTNQEVGIERSHSGAGVSNSYLFVLATTGIIGFLTFVVYCVYTIRSILKVTQIDIRYGTLAIFSAVLIGSITENIFFYSFILIIICGCMGVVNLLMGKSGQ